MVRRRQKKTSVKCKNVQKTKQTAFDSSPHLQRCVYCGQMDQLATSIACFKMSRRSVSDMFLCHAQLAGAVIIFRCWFFHTLLSAPLLPCFCPWAVLLSLEVGLSTLVAALCFFGLSFSCADLTWQSRWRFSWDCRETCFAHYLFGSALQEIQHGRALASRGWAEPSLSLPAAFLFLANCFQMLHSTLAALCAARHLCASHNRCMIILLVFFDELHVPSAVVVLRRFSPAVPSIVFGQPLCVLHCLSLVSGLLLLVPVVASSSNPFR